MSRSIARLALALLAVAVLQACSREAPPAFPPPTATGTSLTVSDISVGRGVNPDRTIADKTDTFRPQDTFYVSVRTEGSSSGASLKARWIYDNGQPVSESTESIAPTGTAVTELHAVKPDGWPVGNYKVEVLLDGVSAGTHEFKVE